MTVEAVAAIEQSEQSGVAMITISNVAKANAVDAAMRDRLLAAWDWAERSQSVNAVLVTGKGERHFCAGADLGRLSQQVSTGGDRVCANTFAPRRAGLTKPIVVAVNGAVVGAAIGLVADADVVVATRTAYLTDPHVDLGMVSAYTALRLASKLPYNVAAQLALSGRSWRLEAERAHALGLVSELLASPEEARRRALEIATSLADKPEWASRSTLGFLRKYNDNQDALIEQALQAARAGFSREDTRHALSRTGDNTQ